MGLRRLLDREKISGTDCQRPMVYNIDPERTQLPTILKDPLVLLASLSPDKETSVYKMHDPAEPDLSPTTPTGPHLPSSSPPP